MAKIDEVDVSLMAKNEEVPQKVAESSSSSGSTSCVSRWYDLPPHVTHLMASVTWATSILLGFALVIFT